MTESAVLACVDGSIYSQSVAEHAGWAASRLGAPAMLMQVLGRRDPKADDRSGRIVAGARRQLLEELAALDAERAKLAMAQARLDLEEAADQARAAGAGEVGVALRNGDLLEEIAAQEASARLIVIGKRGEAADFAKLHLGSNLERILRSTHRPVLVAARAFRPVRRAMIAFDGRPAADRLVEAVAASPLLRGLEIVVVMASDGPRTAPAALEAAVGRLKAAGLEARAEIKRGAAKSVIPEAVAAEEIDLLAMGAYGGSILHKLVIGSTTSQMIRDSRVSILVHR